MCIFLFIFLPCCPPSFTILPFLSFWCFWRLHLEDLGLTLVIFRRPQSIRCGLPYLPPIQDSFIILPIIFLLSIFLPYLILFIQYYLDLSVCPTKLSLLASSSSVNLFIGLLSVFYRYGDQRCLCKRFLFPLFSSSLLQMFSVTFFVNLKCPYISCLNSYMARIQNTR